MEIRSEINTLKALLTATEINPINLLLDSILRN